MAVLQDAAGRRVSLSARTMVGRSEKCLVRLNTPRVSAEHAVIVWTGKHWQIRDLSSRNGTYVDNKQLKDRDRCPIQFGTKLVFADLPWLLACDRSPAVRAVSTDGRTVEEDEEGFLDLGGLAIVDRHLLDTDTDTGATPGREVQDQEVFEVSGARWTLELPPPTEQMDSTEGAQAMELSEVTLKFRVSSDEERVSLELIAKRGRPVELGTRAYQKLLLVLARERLYDTQQGLPSGEAGWVDSTELQRWMDMGRSRLNMEVCRARRALEIKGVMSALNIVERRPGQLRIGLDRLAIEKSSCAAR